LELAANARAITPPIHPNGRAIGVKKKISVSAKWPFANLSRFC
jgi:hypothetical protein